MYYSMGAARTLLLAYEQYTHKERGGGSFLTIGLIFYNFQFYVRTHCLYTLAGLRETIPISLTQEVSEVPEHLHGQKDVPVAPVLLQRRWARISRQYMAEYRKGADGSEAILAVKALRSKRHRDTSDARSRAAEASMAEMSNHL